MTGTNLPRLVAVMDALLAPDGCPWDREQTLASLRPFLIEETYEVLDALDQGSATAHCEELGDLLMQIVFQSALRQRAGEFTLDDVITGICDKLVRRHPHVFAARTELTSGEVLAQWDEIKKAEKKGTTADRTLDGIPKGLPALARAQKVSSRVAKVGFDWPTWDGALAKVHEETAEVVHAKAEGDDQAVLHEIGDLLFAVVNLARKLGVDAEDALVQATARFGQRFAYVEDALANPPAGAAPRRPTDATLEEMDALWNEAKKKT